jgi:hypothetical protein
LSSRETSRSAVAPVAAGGIGQAPKILSLDRAVTG